jgi:hypothetical protein
MDEAEAEDEHGHPEKDEEKQRQRSVDAEERLETPAGEYGAGDARPGYPCAPVKKPGKAQTPHHPSGEHDGLETLPQDDEYENDPKTSGKNVDSMPPTIVSSRKNAFD